MTTRFMKVVIFALLLILVSVGSNCSEQISVPFASPRVIQSEAKFVDGTPQNIKITEGKINLPSKEVLTEIIFFDRDNCVFIGNKFNDKNERQRTFFKTFDGGKSWQSNEVIIPKDSGISQLFFINQNIGWMILFNNGNAWEAEKQTWLMKTIDAGKTWEIIKTANKTTFENVFFTDEKNGWMIGNEYSLEPTVTVKPLVYKTFDGGENWTDTSTQLRSLIGIDSGKAHIGNLLVEDSQILKVTNKYNIFESNDGGKTWHNYGPSFRFLRDQNALGNIGKIGQTNRIKAAQGGMTIEGRYVYLATEEADGNWISREIKEPINLSNAAFLTEKDVFIFGEIQKGLSKQDWENRFGVIYYSADGGTTFKKIYETQKTSGFSDVHKIKENQFFVAAEDGLIVNIELRQ